MSLNLPSYSKYVFVSHICSSSMVILIEEECGIDDDWEFLLAVVAFFLSSLDDVNIFKDLDIVVADWHASFLSLPLPLSFFAIALKRYHRIKFDVSILSLLATWEARTDIFKTKPCHEAIPLNPIRIIFARSREIRLRLRWDIQRRSNSVNSEHRWRSHFDRRRRSTVL